MAGFVGGRALGRHGLHVVHVAVVCEDGECCWVEGLQVDVVVVVGRFLLTGRRFALDGRALGRHGLHVAVWCEAGEYC